MFYFEYPAIIRAKIPAENREEAEKIMLSKIAHALDMLGLDVTITNYEGVESE